LTQRTHQSLEGQNFQFVDTISFRPGHDSRNLLVEGKVTCPSDRESGSWGM
jgi:hypothetical protein